MLDNIPAELRALNQWVVCGPTKQPIDPRTRKAASVTDPSTWATFEQAASSGYSLIGFVFTKNDPYAFIDLDDKEDDPASDEQKARFVKIMEACGDTYTELSASGRGVHIVGRGAIPNGKKRDHVEIYSDARFAVFTGRAIRMAPLNDIQPTLSALHAQMTDQMAKVELVDRDSVISDEDLYDMGANAVNGDKFVQLWNGDWEGTWPSQSEADLALLSMLAFYSKDNEQCRRVFRYSALGKRDKAIKNNKFLDRTLARIRANEPPEVDLSAFGVTTGAQGTNVGANVGTPAASPIQPPKIGAPPVSSGLMRAPALEGDSPKGPDQMSPRAQGYKYTLPPGLIGEVASYMYSAAIRPVPEIALAGAIAFVAGIAGRSYNISGSGLAQYLVLLAPTGTGKESIAGGIDALVASIRPTVPMVDQFIGPASFSSAQAVTRQLSERPCFVSILGEFGLTLQAWSASGQLASVSNIRRVLLDLYGKTGFTKILRPSVYSDKEKDTSLVQAPNLTFLGESTPGAFYEGLTPSMIAEGLIPRFSIIEYTGPRPARNLGANHPPPEAVTSRLCELVALALYTEANTTVGTVGTTAGAQAMLDAFDKHADRQINADNDEVERQLWNRAHLKALKLAALIAVGCNMHTPVIDEAVAKWAIEFITDDVETILGRFQRKEVGNGESTVEFYIRKAVEDYRAMDQHKRVTTYKVPQVLAAVDVIPFSYLRRRLRGVAAITNDKRGMASAIESALKDMVKAEILTEIPPQQVRKQFGVSSGVFLRGGAF